MLRDALDDRLRESAYPVQTMDVVTLEGFLSSVLSHPNRPTDEVWLPWVWARRPAGRAVDVARW